MLALSLMTNAWAISPAFILPAIALHRTDLPPGAQLYVSRFWTNTQAALRDHARIAVYRRHSRLLSYADSFSRPLSGRRISVSGVDLARCEITVFRTTRGAHWYVRWLLPKLQRDSVAGTTTGGTRFGQARHDFPYRRIAAPAVGNEAASFSAGWAADEFAYHMRAVIFRQGRYVVLLHVNGLDGRTPPSLVVRIAKTIDQRIIRRARF